MSAAANKPQEFDHQDDRGEQGSAVPGPTSTSTTTAIDGDEPLAVAQAATTTTTTTTPGVKVDENPAREAAPLIQTKDLATPASSQPPAPQPLLDSAAARLPEETGGAEEDATAAADPAAEADPSQGSTTNAKESDAADTEAAAADLWKEQADDLLAAVGDPDLLLASSSHRTSSVSGAIPLEREHNHHPEVPALPVAPPAPAAPPVSSSATPDNNNNNSNNENDGNEASRKRKDPPTSDPDDNAKDMGNVSNGNDDADGAGTAEGSSSAPNSAVTAAPPGSGSSPKRRATPTRVSWEDRLNQLKQYKSEHGDLLIPIRFKPNPSLGKFVHNTREQYKLYHKLTPAGYKKKCSLTAERLAQLEEIGACGNVLAEPWHACPDPSSRSSLPAPSSFCLHYHRLCVEHGTDPQTKRRMGAALGTIAALQGRTRRLPRPARLQRRPKLCRMDPPATDHLRLTHQGGTGQRHDRRSHAKARGDGIQLCTSRSSRLRFWDCSDSL